jgi:hypothetical protein
MAAGRRDDALAARDLLRDGVGPAFLLGGLTTDEIARAFLGEQL